LSHIELGECSKKNYSKLYKRNLPNFINLGQDDAFCEDGRQNSMYDEKQVTLTMIE
jgi:hypothetical protein